MTENIKKLAREFEVAFEALSTYEYMIPANEVIEDAYEHGGESYKEDKVARYLENGLPGSHGGVLDLWGELDGGNRKRFALKIAETYGEEAEATVSVRRAGRKEEDDD